MPLEYGLIAYVDDPLAEFIASLRRDLQPEDVQAMGHISVLPPRPLRGDEAGALEFLEERCQAVQPFEVALGEVENFIPRTPTVFIRVAQGAYRMRELHDRLNASAFEFNEPFPYMPHLTIFRMEDEGRAQAAMSLAQRRWAEYAGPRRVLIDQLVFVRGSRQHGWADIAPVRLGRRLAPAGAP